MAYDFSLSGIRQVQAEIDQMDDDFKETASQIHSSFSSTRKKQLDEIEDCKSQITMLDAEIIKAQQTIKVNNQTEHAAEVKISHLEEEQRKLVAYLESARKTLCFYTSQYATCREPQSSGNYDTDRTTRQAYYQQKTALLNQVSCEQRNVANFENKIDETKREIERLKQIVVKVNNSNKFLSENIIVERDATKRAVQTHLDSLNKTKSNLSEAHDAFNTYYGYAQDLINSTHRRVKEAFADASMAVNALNKLDSFCCDRVEMDDNALAEAIRALKAYADNLQENIIILMRRKDAFRAKLQDKISERVKEEMERIDRIVSEIDLKIDNIMRTLSEAQSYLSNYGSWADGN